MRKYRTDLGIWRNRRMLSDLLELACPPLSQHREPDNWPVAHALDIGSTTEARNRDEIFTRVLGVNTRIQRRILRHHYLQIQSARHKCSRSSDVWNNVAQDARHQCEVDDPRERAYVYENIATSGKLRVKRLRGFAERLQGPMLFIAGQLQRDGDDLPDRLKQCPRRGAVFLGLPLQRRLELVAGVLNEQQGGVF